MGEVLRAPGRRRAAAVAVAAAALSGCSASTVGDSWQCPLAQGEACASVAAVDPAVPKADGAATAGTADPLYRPRPAPAPQCASGCNPFAWLAELIEGGGDAGEENADADVANAPGENASSSAANGAAPAASTVPAGEELRTAEVVGRIWIAPYVDADGVYHEAGWVRAVIAPAGWRLP